MSRRDKRYYWRHVVCDGCEHRCRYRDFRAGGPSFREVYAYLRGEIAREGSRYRFKRRGTVLGLMHQHKRALWEEMVGSCPDRKEARDDSAVDGQQEESD